MVKSPHEALHRIFQEDSGLFARVFERLLGLKFTEPYSVSVLSPDMTELKPVERRADTVLMIESNARTCALIVESQTEKVEEKRHSWPYYIAYLHAKHGCDVGLLVVTSKDTTARWAREPIKVGIGNLTCMVVQPTVLGPDNFPKITTAEEAAQDVVYALLSAITHGRSEHVDEILKVLAAALDTVDIDTAGLIAEFAEIGLGEGDARQYWRDLMATNTYRYQSEYAEMLRSEGRAEGRAEGHAEGEAKLVLRALERHGIAVPETTRRQIMSCTDTALLEEWFDRALTATKVEDLFI